MSLPRMQRTTPFAPWSLRIVSLASQLLVATTVLHRFAALPTGLAVNVMLVAFAACGVAVLGGVLALARIWRHGTPGAGAAAGALLIGALLLLVPAYYLPLVMRGGGGYDVSTDRAQPPAYVALAKARQAAGVEASVQPAAATTSELVVAPIVTTRTPSDVFDLANDVLKQLDLTVVAEEAPGFGDADGTMEASERTLILGLTDDIAIRIGSRDGATRIDVRSAARFPRLDLGRNQERVGLILQKLQASIDASLPSEDGQSADLGVAPGDSRTRNVKTPGGTAGAGTVPHRKKRVPAQASAQGAPTLTISPH